MITEEAIRSVWPNAAEITAIHLSDREGDFLIANNGTVGKIEKTAREGEHSFIPYVRVYFTNGGTAEFCQHRLHSVYFMKTK